MRGSKTMLHLSHSLGNVTRPRILHSVSSFGRVVLARPGLTRLWLVKMHEEPGVCRGGYARRTAEYE